MFLCTTDQVEIIVEPVFSTPPTTYHKCTRVGRVRQKATEHCDFYMYGTDLQLPSST